MLVKLMLRPGALKALKEARRLTENVTPLKKDCGRLCDGACCQPDETGENGMLLFPYEEAFYREESEGFPFRLVPDDSLYQGGFRLVCEGRCEREKRPLACRIFPLRVKVQEGEDERKTEVELDPRAWACCPLLEQGGMRAIGEDFQNAVREAGEVMVRNTTLLEALLNEQRLIDELTKFGG